MTAFDPVTAADGAVAGWTGFNGFALGKDDAAVNDRFVVYDGGYIDWFLCATIYQTSLSRANHFIEVDFKIAAGGGDVALYFNAVANGSTNNNFVVQANGAWQLNHQSGGITSGGAGSLAVVAGTPFTLSVDASTNTDPVIKFNGSTVSLGTSVTNSGNYVGLYINGTSNTGEIQIEPSGPPPTVVPQSFFFGG